MPRKPTGRPNGRPPGKPNSGPLCGARKTEGGTCKNPAGKGTEHLGFGACYRHGGRTRTHQVKAEKLMADQALADALTTFGLEVETTAEEALLGALWRAHGTVLFYRDRVRKLTDDQMVYGTRRITRTLRPAPVSGQPQQGPTQVLEDVTVAESVANVWLKLLAEAEKHLLAVAASVATLNIAQRRQAHAEEQGEFLFRAMGLILARMGIEDDDPRLPLVVGEVLAELTA